MQILLNYLTDQEKTYIHPWFKLQILETIYNSTCHEEYCAFLLQDRSELKAATTDKTVDSTPSKKNKKYESFFIL